MTVHYHGFEWSGAREDLERRKGERRPGAAEFMSSRLPTDSVVQALLRPASSIAETFTDALEAARWLSDQWRDHPTSGRYGSTPDEYEVAYRASLTIGQHCVAGFYVGQAYRQSSMVVCGVRQDVRCPAPPK